VYLIERNPEKILIEYLENQDTEAGFG